MGARLTIGIPTVTGREAKFDRLYQHIMKQKTADVQVVSIKDNKEMSIGEKRGQMYKMSKGDYSVQIDDDDFVPDNYVEKVLTALETSPDCVGYIERCTFDGKDGGNSLFTLQYPDWIENINTTCGEYKIVRIRTPFFKTPIKTNLCQMVSVAHMRWGEDHDFARRIYAQLKTEVIIPELMYLYGFETEGEYKDRFGL